MVHQRIQLPYEQYKDCQLYSKNLFCFVNNAYAQTSIYFVEQSKTEMEQTHQKSGSTRQKLCG